MAKGDSKDLCPRYLEWAREIEALAQTSIHYSENEYQRARNRRLLEIAAEIIAENAGLDPVPIARAFSSQLGYATPKIDVRAAVFQKDRILLVRESCDGGWTMPGGWADVGDVPSRAAEREAREESGYEVRACRLVGVYDTNRTGPLEIFHAFKIVFLCDLVGGIARTSDETSEVGFFSINEIPVPLSGERTKPRHLDDAFRCRADSGCDVVFD
jgi:ADP-ribose pyrophosphatase YjhB (NUDIX family)